jgi:anti-sigma-K factor RskA
MSSYEPTSDPRDCGADAAGYVLGALDGTEVERFRRHMSQCVVCRDEVLTLQVVANALPMATPHLRAPRALARRTRARVRSESSVMMSPHRSGRQRVRIPRVAVVFACVLAALAMTVGVLHAGASANNAVRTVPAAVIDQGQLASALLRVSNGRAELVVAHMPAPPTGKIYEVWLQHPGQAPEPTSALFGVTSSGRAAVDVPGNLTGVAEVMVTPEPLGGSRVPTHAPVILAALAS